MEGRYTQEFKESAIQLALNSEKSVIQFGMSSKTLYDWLRNYQQKHNLSNSIESTSKLNDRESLQEENRHLYKELTIIKKEKEILK